MKLKVFTREGCQEAKYAREIVGCYPEAKLYNLDNIEGLAEAAYHSVLCIPSAILTDDSDTVIQSWRGTLPRPTELDENLR